MLVNAISEKQLLSSMYKIVLLLFLVPPFIGGTLMGVAGFYPLPEFYMIFFSYSTPYVLVVLSIVLFLTPRLHKYLVNLVQLPNEVARKKVLSIFSNLHWYMITIVTIYSIFGSLSADISLESMGYADYSFNEHLIHQFGLVPVVLITTFPAFFYFADRCGLFYGERGIQVNAVPLWVKVMMLGVVTPLLIDSLLIGYFYNRTGYFSNETLIIWFSLLILAIGGTWLAWRSIYQGLMPLHNYVSGEANKFPDPQKLVPLSLDELGSLVSRFSELTEELKKEHDFASAIVNTSPVIILILDVKGYIQFINPWFENLTGYKIDEVKGKEWFATFLPERDRDQIRELFHQATHAEPVRGYINPILTSEGDELQVEWYSEAMLDSNGDIVSLLSIGQDVTRRREAEKELREQKEQLHALLENLPHGVQQNDLSGTITYSNPAHAHMFGFTQDEMVGKKIWEFLPETEKAGFQQYFKDLIVQRPRPGSYIGQNICKDGSVIDVSVDWDYINDNKGQLQGFISIITDLTARKRAEQTLKQQEALLDSFFSQSIDGCFFMMLDKPLHWDDSVDKDALLDYVFNHQKITRVNDAMLDQYGGKAAEFIGLTPADLMAHDIEYGKQLWRQLFDEGRLNIRTEEQKIDGTPMWIEGEYVCLYDEQGNISGHFGIQRDVTEEKILEDELHKNQERLNEAQHIAKVGSWELELGSNKLYWTDEIYNLFETDKESFGASYDAFLNAIHPDDRERVNAAYSHSLESQEPYTIVHRLLMADGRIKWVEERCNTDFADDGTPLISRGTVQDITTRQLLEDELRFLNEQLEQRVKERSAELYIQNKRNEAILHTTPDGFFSADMQGNIVHANPAFCKMLGYSQSEITQLTIADIEASENPEEVAQHINKVIEQGYDRFETRHKGNNGNEIDIDISVSTIEIDGQNMFYAFARDISERKLAEKNILAARYEAERANSAKSEFLSRMSHELRTPLNAIIGFSELMSTDEQVPLTGEQADNLGEIRHAGNQLLELVNEILDLSRIESGRLDVNLETVYLSAAVNACISQCHPMATKHQVSIVHGDDCDRYAVKADALRLKEVLLNLMTNAIKYNRKNGKVWIRCKQLETGFIRISVQDTGRGIGVDMQEHIFKPFERLESAYDGIEGSGIGLALVKRLVEAMGGNTGVSSQPGEGSTFWFDLPETDATLPAQEKQQEVSKDSEAPYKLLLVEDNRVNRQLIRKILEKQNKYQILEAEDAESGIDIARNDKPDIILHDINLPGMDGYQALAILKEDSSTRDIPVIALTANAMYRDVERGMSAGFDDYITKPIDVANFVSKLEPFLKYRK